MRAEKAVLTVRSRRQIANMTEDPGLIKAPVAKPSRSVPAPTRLFLYVQAGGRCEFDGCNKYLLEHYPTESPGNFAEQAHIYAFAKSGPRGSEPGRPAEINSIENLILLCPECHHLVDSVDPASYPVEVLRKFKRDHEDRIFWLTDLSKDRATIPLVIKGLIVNRPVEISDEEMQVAVAPSYLRRRDKVEIDLTAVPDEPTLHYWQSAASTIDRQVRRLLDLPPENGRSLRVSVFGLAAIPLLVYLGSRLSDKTSVDLYQRHRHPETWKWFDEPGEARFSYRVTAEASGSPVALLINISGKNDVQAAHSALGTEAQVYELTLDDQAPNPLCLRTRDDLDRFTTTYNRLLSHIRAAHPQLEAVHVFPAVPAPIAITLGRARLPKVDPRLVIWDRDSRAGGFTRTLEIS
ncbi:MAG: SAVED domain-containing protein [Acidobacteria bacterium]|nr:SAVED domain-containing protein [Acidobacteriota bacterium]